MKILYTLALYVLCILPATGQQFWNEWIVPGQPYYKIKVTRNGIHRIDKTTMNNAGINVDIPLPSNYQIIHNGEEIPIYVGTVSGFLSYIEFYGEKNTGWPDTALYVDPDGLANPYYSLITDTSAYFLSWNNRTDNLRMEVTSSADYAGYTVANYCMAEKLEVYTSGYNYGLQSDMRYNDGEGWCDASYTDLPTNSVPDPKIEKNLVIDNIYTGFSTAYIEMGIVGISNAGTGAGNHHLNVTLNGNNLFDFIYSMYGPSFTESQIPVGWLTTTNKFVLKSVDDLFLSADKSALTFLKIRYPHTYNFQNDVSFSFSVPQSATAPKTTLSITGFDGGTSPVMYDLTQSKRISVIPVSGAYKAVVENYQKELKCIIMNPESIIPVTQLTGTSFTDYSVYGFNSDYIIITHPELESSALSYATYRNSTGFNVLLVDAETLYDQFSYGIYKHPVAIRNFMKYIITTYDTVPKYLFLLGKGIHAYGTRKNSYWYSKNYVPTMGASSDLLFTTGLNGAGYEPAVPTGRLAAYTTDEVDTYFTKVKTHENLSPEEWQKIVLHFGGGSTPDEQDTFADHLNNYKNIIEGPFFGGHVHTFLKQSSDPISQPLTATIKELIDNGCALMTFFGHGSGNIGFDQNTDHPDNYNNDGKYPMIFGNSCYVGDIYTTNVYGMREIWVFHERGSIGFLSSISKSLASDLNRFAQEFYNNLAYKTYHRGIGDVVQQTIYYLQQDYQYDWSYYEYALHCDPAISIGPGDKPDLSVNASEILLDPDYITTEIDSFDVNVVVTNIGKSTDSTFIVTLRHTIPDGTATTHYRSQNGCYFKDTVTYTLPVDPATGVGYNTVRTDADITNTVDEVDDVYNNSAERSFLIVSEDLVPIWPYEYAIYPDPTVTLKASASNPFLTGQTCRFEIDTTDLFSPYSVSGEVVNNGGVVTWTVPFTLTENTVYFWRIKPATGDENSWRESSFIYIPAKTGWSQAHFFQFKKDDFRFIDYNRTHRSLDFFNTVKEMVCNNPGWPTSTNYKYYYTFNNFANYSSCGGGAKMNIAVFEDLTLIPWLSDRGNYGHVNYPICGPSQPQGPKYYFAFTDLYSMADFLANVIPDGNWVLIQSFVYPNFHLWPDEAFDAVEGLTTTPTLVQIRNVGDYNPYIFFGQKGTSTFVEEYGAAPDEEIQLRYDVPYSFNCGSITSVDIGPTNNWESLHWQTMSSETPSDDFATLIVSGITSSGNDTVLIDSLNADSTDIYNLT
ncbi:MAG: hypothetical protein KJ607_04290, partial [Bacteroidetes bacterium]|nr:hypothetical protein [Bacteroidota bacterium]